MTSTTSNDESGVEDLLRYAQNNETDEFMKVMGSLDSCLHLNSINEIPEHSCNECKASWDVLQWACFHGNEKILKSILNLASRERAEKRNHLNLTSKREYFTPLHIAAQRNHLNICWLLLGLNLHPTQILDEVQQDHLNNINIESISTLLNQRDQYGNTTLHTSAASGNRALVQWHLNVGANPTSKNKFNLTPFDVASNDSCRSLLKTHLILNDEDSEAKNAAKTMLHRYFEYQSKLKDIITSNLADVSERYDLNEIHQLIKESISFGLTEELIQKVSYRLEWLKARREILSHIDEVKSNAPIVSKEKYEYVNDLRNVVSETSHKEEKCGLIPEDLLNILQGALSLCDRSTSELKLNDAYCQCQQISCANKSHEGLMKVLDECITKAKDTEADNVLLENGLKIYERMMAELSLTAATESIPTPKLPVDGLTKKQLKSYWSEEDIGHVKETEEFPLPPPGEEGYIWVKSTALQSLEKALNYLQETLKEAELCNGNSDLIESGKTVLKEKKTTDLTLLLEKDESDKLLALAAVEKAAKKLLKKKKKGSKKK